MRPGKGSTLGCSGSERAGTDPHSHPCSSPPSSLHQLASLLGFTSTRAGASLAVIHTPCPCKQLFLVTPCTKSNLSSEGHICVLALDHLSRKFQHSDALTMVYKRERRDALSLQNLCSAGMVWPEEGSAGVL